jgi:hypothetical protein
MCCGQGSHCLGRVGVHAQVGRVAELESVDVGSVMKFRANTLLNPWVIFCIWLVLWAARLRLIPDYYQRTWELGYYPPEADTIVIPIAGNVVLTILLAPVFALALWLMLRRSSFERRIWLAWHRRRWVVSLAWTLLFSSLAILTLPTLAEDIRIGLPINAVADVGWFFLWLAVRAVVVSRIPEGGLTPNEASQAIPAMPGS